MSLTLADLFASPDHYLHSIDGDAAVFVPMDRAAYGRSIFLDGRIDFTRNDQIFVHANLESTPGRFSASAARQPSHRVQQEREQ